MEIFIVIFRNYKLFLDLAESAKEGEISHGIARFDPAQEKNWVEWSCKVRDF